MPAGFNSGFSQLPSFNVRVTYALDGISATVRHVPLGG
jgi:hypothetical protein